MPSKTQCWIPRGSLFFRGLCWLCWRFSVCHPVRFPEFVWVGCEASDAGVREDAVKLLLVGEGAGAGFVLDGYDKQVLSHAVQGSGDLASFEQLVPGYVRGLFEMCREFVVVFALDRDQHFGVDGEFWG